MTASPAPTSSRPGRRELPRNNGCFQRRILEHEEKNILLRIFGKTPALGPRVLQLLFLLLDEFLGIDEFIHVFAGGDLLDDRSLIFRCLLVFRLPFDENGVMIDQVVE